MLILDIVRIDAEQVMSTISRHTKIIENVLGRINSRT